MGCPVVHFEIHGNDDGHNDFYSEVFGWKVDADNPMNYGMVDTDSGEGIAGGLTKSDTAPAVMVYVQVDDLDATLAEVTAKGGATIMPASDVPGGPTMAIFADPSGNHIGLVKADSMG